MGRIRRAFDVSVGDTVTAYFAVDAESKVDISSQLSVHLAAQDCGTLEFYSRYPVGTVYTVEDAHAVHQSLLK